MAQVSSGEEIEKKIEVLAVLVSLQQVDDEGVF
jgi:hypothetical protein